MKEKKCALILVLLSIVFGLLLVPATAQTEYGSIKAEQSEWKGFIRYNFEFEEKKAHLIMPARTLSGNPWVWRARFPEWHTEMDSILLSEGFHVAYINTANQYGSPNAMAIWDRFYQWLRQSFNLNEKVALEGVSRGGLFVHNWAKQNVEKVTCIYAEAPVCDFKSWPGGFGNGKGSPEDWERLKTEYGFSSDNEAMAWNDQPIDNLEKLAKAKVPILHMIGLKDKVVPVEENTRLLTDRYVKLGGPVTIIPCTKGKQDLWGHHFPIETPRIGADFIKYHSKLPEPGLNSADYHQVRGGLKNACIKFVKEKEGRVAFLGGSITYNGGWRDSICQYLMQRFPQTKFDFITAGIPSMGTTPAAFRLERDILTKGPVDLLFEEAAVNDATNGRTNEEQIRAMEGIVRQVRRANPASDIVIMHFVDPDKMEKYRRGDVPKVIWNHEKVAQHYNIATINLAREVTDRIDAGEFTWEGDFKNLHPSPFGQGIYAHSMITFLDNAWGGFATKEEVISRYVMPEKVDVACYDNGMLISVEKSTETKGWFYNKQWQPSDGAGTRTNYVNVPMLIGNDPGKIKKFVFNGTTVGMAVAAGPDAGIIEYRVDKGPWKRKDLFTKWSAHLHLPWYYTLQTGLNPGKHVLRFRLLSEKNKSSVGNSCRLRYFYVNK